jgi:hypothetical protein
MMNKTRSRVLGGRFLNPFCIASVPDWLSIEEDMQCILKSTERAALRLLPKFSAANSNIFVSEQANSYNKN